MQAGRGLIVGIKNDGDVVVHHLYLRVLLTLRRDRLAEVFRGIADFAEHRDVSVFDLRFVGRGQIAGVLGRVFQFGGGILDVLLRVGALRVGRIFQGACKLLGLAGRLLEVGANRRMVFGRCSFDLLVKFWASLRA